MTLYYFTLALMAVVGIVILLIIGIAVVTMVRRWDSDPVQNLDGPVREYLLTDDVVTADGNSAENANGMEVV